MRLDKYLKVSRLIKRRTVANEACDAGRVMVNDKVVKASYDVKVGDVATVIGDEDNSLTAVNVASESQSIANELLCRIGIALYEE